MDSDLTLQMAVASKAKDLADLFVVQFSQRLCGSESVPSLGDHVRDVIQVCSKEEVVRLDASRGVAFVKAMKPVWNWSEMIFPGDTMGWEHRMSFALLSADSSVPFVGSGASPGPAWGGEASRGWAVFVDPRPEASVGVFARDHDVVLGGGPRANNLSPKVRTGRLMRGVGPFMRRPDRQRKCIMRIGGVPSQFLQK